MTSLCLLLIGVSFLLSAPLCWWLIRAGQRLGQLDHPDDPATGGRKWHSGPTPNTGGVAITAAVVLPIAVGLLAVWLAPASLWQGPFSPAAEHLPGLRQQTRLVLGVMGGVLVLHVLGLIDDRKRLGPFVKLAVQLAVAGALAGVFDIRVFEFLDRYGPFGAACSIGLSALWIVAVTNAMNFLDNMDGLSAGVGAIVAGLYLAATLIAGQWFVAALAALLLGALLGFLVFNFPPAFVFMGDGGSLVLGLLLAVISVRTTYFASQPGQASQLRVPGNWYGVLMPLIVLAVPLYDLTSVTLIRLRQGKSPFVGDRNHFSHRLVRKGLGQRGAVIVIWLCTLATGLGGVVLGSLSGWQAAVVAAQVVAVLAVLAMVERSGPS